MTVKYCIKTHERVINDLNIHYSPSRFDAALGTAEKLLVTAIATDTTGSGDPTLDVGAEFSNDGISWSDPILIFSEELSVGGTTHLNGQLLGDDVVLGRYVRIAAALNGTDVGSFIRIWVCGRSFV